MKSRRQEFKEYNRFNEIIEQQNELSYLKREVEKLRKQKKLMERTVIDQNSEIEKIEKENEETMVEKVKIIFVKEIFRLIS